MPTETLTIDGQAVHIGHPDKHYWPSVTKRDLIAYYLRMAPLMLPYLAGRYVTLVRWPEGLGGEFFFQKHLADPGDFPAGLRADVHGIFVESRAALAYLANLGTLELHMGLSPASDLSSPTWAVFDLDPIAGASWQDLLTAARAIRDLLAGWGMSAFGKTSGKSGIHLFVPLGPGETFNRVQGFVRMAGEELAKRMPGFWSFARSRTERVGRVYLDYLQNWPARSMVCPYSPRGTSPATVSWPFSWDDPPKAPTDITVAVAPAMAGGRNDPWAGMAASVVPLPGP